MIDKDAYKTFKNGSRTYFYSSLFFPESVKSDVFTLYRFVREADNLVDTIPQKKVEFLNFKRETESALNNKNANNPTISNFIQLSKKYEFNDEWIKSFLFSMESDLHSIPCITLQDSEKYMYGSAEVIGLFMAKILSLSTESYTYAQLLGRSMQYANFIRDIAEDIQLGRQYLPIEEMKNIGIKDLSEGSARENENLFKKFIALQIDHYWSWQDEAEKGFKYIPVRYRIPIQTASDMYKWTIEKISKNPLLVYKKSLKPSRRKILSQIVFNTLTGNRHEI